MRRLTSNSMLHVILVLFAILFLNFLTGCSHDIKRTGTTKVLCLGDSITYGLDGGGYRRLLFEQLGLNYESMGSQSFGDFTQNRHEGHPGYMIKNLRGLPGLQENLRTWYVGQPDIILLHIGTNNLAANYPYPYAAAEAFSDLQGLLVELRNLYPHARIVISKIIALSEEHNTELTVDQFALFQTAIADYNALIGTLNVQGLSIVDMGDAGLNGSDFIDMAHPNSQGADKMANVWLKALVQ